MEGLLLEARMRARIAELQAYRRQGVRTLAAAEVFETERRRHKQQMEAALQAGVIVYADFDCVVVCILVIMHVHALSVCKLALAWGIG